MTFPRSQLSSEPDAGLEAGKPPRGIVAGLGLLAMIAGLITLGGWAANAPRLTDWWSAGISMLPNMAAAVTCSGAALFLIAFGRRWIPAALGLFTSLIGAATLFEFVTGLDLHFDTLLLYREWGQRATMAPGRIGPPGATSLTILGAAIFLLATRRSRQRLAASGGVAVCAIALLSINGYLFGAGVLYSVPYLTTIALQTATVLLALGIAVAAAAPEVNPMKTLMENSAAGTLARRGLPIVILLPMGVAWACEQGQKAGIYNEAFGLALGTLLEVLLLALLLWRAAAAVKAHEEPLRQTRARLEGVLASVTDGFHIIDGSGRFTYFNTAARNIYEEQGLNADDLLGKRLLDEVFPDARETTMGQAIHRTLTQKEPTEAENFYAPWGRWISARNYPIAEGGVSTFFRDVTERRLAEEKLKLSEERFRALGDNISQLAWMTDAQGAAFWYNRRWEDFTGCSLEGMQGEGSQKIQHPDYAQSVREKFNQAIAKGTEWEDTFPLRGKDGNYRWFLSRAVPIRDAEQKITCWFGTNTDITELRETQEILRTAQEELQQHALNLEKTAKERTLQLEETLSDMEAFSYSISHDMRAPLRAMQGFSDALLSDYGDKLDEQGQLFLRRIHTSSSRLDMLIQDVLRFSRVAKEDLRLAPVDLTAILRDTIETFPTLQKPVEITMQDPLPRVLGHAAYVGQIFSNLMTNAVKFAKKGIPPRLEIWAEADGDMVRIWVSDNGIGISPSNYDRIFQMFGRVYSETQYEGTGIGLAIVKKAVDRMGGRIGVRSTLGEGSHFWFTLKSAP